MPDTFRPGDQVDVIDGTFVGMMGDVIGFEDDPATPGVRYVRVGLTVYGKRIPITLLPEQLVKS